MSLSLADANRKYFDAVSDSFDNNPWFAEVYEKITNSLHSQLDWVGVPLIDVNADLDVKEVRLLDYACGSGIMSRIFGPYVTYTRGIDLSPNMVSAFNIRAQSANLAPTQISAIVADLLSPSSNPPNPPSISTPEYHSFDLIACGLAFHHFSDPVHAASVLKTRLRPGGVLLISDFLTGGDVLADENGVEIDGTMGHHYTHVHGHHHDDTHNSHQTILTTTSAAVPSRDDLLSADSDGNLEEKSDPIGHVRKEMQASMIVPSFGIQEVERFFKDAGFVDVDVRVMGERVYMDFGKKMWRTVFFARGRRPEGKVEL